MVGFSKFKILGVRLDVARQRALIHQGRQSTPSGQNLWDKVGGSSFFEWQPHQDGRQNQVGNPKPQNSDSVGQADHFEYPYVKTLGYDPKICLSPREVA